MHIIGGQFISWRDKEGSLMIRNHNQAQKILFRLAYYFQQERGAVS